MDVAEAFSGGDAAKNSSAWSSPALKRALLGLLLPRRACCLAPRSVVGAAKHRWSEKLILGKRSPSTSFRTLADHCSQVVLVRDLLLDPVAAADRCPCC